MIKLTISNQRGGVGKTTTAITLARCFADKGMKVLLFDTDSQGSIAAVLGLRPNAFLYDLLIQTLAFLCALLPHIRLSMSFAVTGTLSRPNPRSQLRPFGNSRLNTCSVSTKRLTTP